MPWSLLVIAAYAFAGDLSPTLTLLNPANGTVVTGALQVRYVIHLQEPAPEHRDLVAAEAQRRLRVCFALDGQTDATACAPLDAGDVTMNNLLPGQRRLEARVLDSAGADAERVAEVLESLGVVCERAAGR